MRIQRGPAVSVNADKLGDVTLAATASSVSIGVPTRYDMLMLFWCGVYGDQASDQYMELTFNDDTGSNYDWSRKNFGTSSGTTNADGSIQLGLFGDTGDAEYHMNGMVVIFNRAAQEKVVIGTYANFSSGGAADEDITGQHIEAKWRNTSAAITKVTLTADSGNFAIASRFTLLGINSAKKRYAV